jgi:hypothetical protein
MKRACEPNSSREGDPEVSVTVEPSGLTNRRGRGSIADGAIGKVGQVGQVGQVGKVGKVDGTVGDAADARARGSARQRL